MSMRWKLRKDKLRDDAPSADTPDTAPASDAPPAAADDAPSPNPSVFDLSGSAFAPLSASQAPAFAPPEDEPTFDAPASVADDDPRFEVDDDALSFLTAPQAAEEAPSPVAEEIAHADAGPQGIAADAEDALSAFAPYRPAAEPEALEAEPMLSAGADEFAHLDAHVSDAAPAFNAPADFAPFAPEPDAPTFALPPADISPVPFSPDRESVAPGLVSQDDGGLPRVAPFVIDLPTPAAPVTDGPHRLVLRLGNLSATYDLAKDVTTIGRPDSVTQNYPDIEIELDDGVSRRHAEIRRSGERYAVVDMGSTNGTILNGEMLAPQQPMFLAHGDRIRVGERTEIVFE